MNYKVFHFFLSSGSFLSLRYFLCTRVLTIHNWILTGVPLQILFSLCSSLFSSSLSNELQLPWRSLMPSFISSNFLVPPFCKFPSGNQLGQSLDLLICLLSPRDHWRSLPNGQCFQCHRFIYLIWFSIVSGRNGQPNQSLLSSRETEPIGYVYLKGDFKELAHAIVETGKSKIYRVSQKSGDLREEPRLQLKFKGHLLA